MPSNSLSKSIDNNKLRNTSFPDLAKYFKHLTARLSNQTINDHLLSALATDALPLRVLSVWIAGFADPASIGKALRYEESCGVRRLAIKRFRKGLRRETEIKALWDVVGGTLGLMRLLSDLSVHDVQSFCHAMGRTSSYTSLKDLRQQYLTELATSLLSDHFPEAKYKNPEVRPLNKFYANIVPACTVEFVRAWAKVEALPRAGGRWMDHAHYEHVRRRCMHHLKGENGKKFRFEHFRNIFHELPPEPHSKYMSQSMYCSLKFLEHLGEDAELELAPAVINNDIVIPLQRRLEKREASLDLRKRVLVAVERALRPRMKHGNTLDFSKHGPLRQVLLCWNRDERAFKHVLIDILRLAPKDQRITLDRLHPLLLSVRESYRPRLLEMSLEHLRTFSKSLSNDGDLKELGPWPSNIFAALPSDAAKLLLMRLIKLRKEEAWEGDIFTSLRPTHAVAVLDELFNLRPAGDFIKWVPLYSVYTLFTISHNWDPLVLQLCVSPRTPDTEQTWHSVVDERKMQAARARDQEDRATWARSAILCSIASGSRDLHEQTLLWARRFNRDALTVKQLYARDVVHSNVGVDLLSGVATDPRATSPTEEFIQRDVEHGNQIMLLLLETAIQGIREPSFQHYDWIAILELFKKVTAARLAQAETIQDRLKLSEKQMFEIVWEPTIATLVRAEERCLMDEHEKLKAQNRDGLPRYSSRPNIRSIRPSACKFADELAKRRSQLWEKHRKAKDPNVVSLPSPWPKGLSFTDAHSISLAGDDRKGYAGRMPYLESRAEGILFPDPTMVLAKFPKDDAVVKAIDGHIDDYEEALEFYLNAAVDDGDRKQRRKRAWDYATAQFGEARGLSAVETILFWENIFTKGPIDNAIRQNPNIPKRQDPVLPTVEDAEEPTEWNPDPDPEQWSIEARDLEYLCLDAMTTSNCDPQTIAYEQAPFWESPTGLGIVGRPMKTVAPASREALVALGLMLINSKCCPTKRLFSKSSPSVEDARFPAIYLDEDFLDRDELSEEQGFIILERLAKDAPLTLVAELCEAMLSNLGQGEDPQREHETETLRLLKILVDGDRPNLVLNLVRRVVLERPDASSWHRHMLTKGLFDRMTSERARSFISDLASCVNTKLGEQAQRKPATKVEAAVSSAPIIKVTTVTAFAQLLSSATFITGEESIDHLTGVFSAATHPDIRVAIIESLTSILKKTRSDTVKARIIDALEIHAVSVASSMNERSPLTESDWQRAEEKTEIPEVNEPQSKALQPVLSAIVAAYTSLIDKDIVEQLYHRILLPVLDASAANNRRWLRIFSRKHNLHLNDIDLLPLIPPKPHFLAQLLTRDVQIRRDEILTIWAEAVQLNLSPSSDLSAINDRILNDRDLRASNGGKHFLSLFNSPGTAALSLAGPTLHQAYLVTPPNTAGAKDKGAMPMQLIQDAVFTQLETMILRSDETFSEQNYVLQQLKRPENKNAAWEGTWNTNVRPVVRRVVELIESLRTKQGQSDPNRQPKALKDTYEMQLWLLNWPGYAAAFEQTAEHERKLPIFCEEIRRELEGLARDTLQTGQPYHEHFATLKDAALKLHPQDLFALALTLGTNVPSDKPVFLVDYLALEVAEEALNRAAMPAMKDSKVVVRVGEMVRAWKGSKDEKVRMAGLRVARTYAAAVKGGGKKWFEEMGGRVE